MSFARRRHFYNNSRSLHVEALEDRRLLAVFTVSNLLDGPVAAAGDLPGSLRQAIFDSNINGEDDTIEFSLTGTIPILSELPQITQDLAIDGANQITIDAGGGATSAAGDGFRIFRIDNLNDVTRSTVTISGLVLTGADTPLASFNGNGGAIYNKENLTVTSSTLFNNQARGGAGIWSDRGVLQVLESTLKENASTGSGGAIFNNLNSTTTVRRSTLFGNSASGGAGIQNNGSTVGIFDSTLSGNMAVGGGGAISNSNGGLTQIDSSTITENTATVGGGIVNLSGSTLNVINSIVAGNTAPGITDDISGTLGTNGFNIIGVDPLLASLGDNGGPTLTHALLPGSPAIDMANPAISDGFDQRGSPFSRQVNGRADIGAFEAGTWVVNSAADNNDGDLSNGVTSLREAINAANAFSTSDYILFDSSLSGETIHLTSQLPTISDELTMTGLGAHQLTIDAGNGTDNIFATSDGFRIFNINDGTGGLIDVAISGLSLTGGDAPMGADGTDSTGGQGANGGAILSAENLTLSEMVVRGNAAGKGGTGGTGDLIGFPIGLSGGKGGSGGGVFSSAGTLTVILSTISGNSAGSGGNGGLGSFDTNGTGGDGGDGGGILSASGTLTVVGSTINGNRSGVAGTGVDVNGASGSQGYGGGIHSAFALELANSTVSGNTADRGGGVYIDFGSANLVSSTLTSNVATFRGGGFYIDAGTAHITGSILAGNISPSFANVSGPLNTNTFNLIDVDPLLGPLTDNGGPTQTHALLPNSLAIDAGNIAIVDPPQFDQRGAPFSRIADGNVPTDVVIDIGAYEAQAAPSADFDTDGDVDGRDFLAWQRGFGKPNAVRSDGNSDDDSDVDGSDLAAWQVSYDSASAPLVELATADAQPSAADVVDVALAVKWRDIPAEEKQLLFQNARPLAEAAIDAVFATNGIVFSKKMPMAGNVATRDSDEAESAAESWLSDELLERVFT